MPSSPKPGIAFIGLGIMGHRMLTNMIAHGGFTLVGGWDPSAAAVAKTRAAFPDLAVAETPGAIVEDPRTHVVYIACPPGAHKAHALAAVGAGKAVFCEKPLGVDLVESRDLVAQVEAAGAKNAVNFPFAEAQAVNAILAAQKSGGLGRPVAADVRLHFARWPRDWQAGAAWLAEREEGGYVREVFSHFAYLIHRLLGPARLVRASLRYPADPKACETHVLALFDCAGVPVTLAGGSGGTGPDRVEFTLWGEKTSYRLWDWNRLKSSDGTAWRDELTHIADPRQDGYRRMLENLLAFLEGRPNTMPSFREALAVQELVEAVLAEG